QINFAQALSKTKDVIVLLFDRSKEAAILLISQLHEIFVKTIEPIRPGRKFPQNHKVHRRCFYYCYKPIR
ncbi:MAG: IS4/IS5 family transposase, partial [Deltaproteobacteria bacterium]|nr:IS4/IS5 family transposase [Deltaproteobacteria bacterium]